MSADRRQISPATALMRCCVAARGAASTFVVAEDMDRIFRATRPIITLLARQLDFLGITIHTATGKVDQDRWCAPRALMGEMYPRKPGAACTAWRKPRVVIRDGRHAGGRAYTAIPSIPGSPGELQIIDDAQARIVVRNLSSRALLPASRLAPLPPNSMPIGIAALRGTRTGERIYQSMATTRVATACCSMSFMPAVSSGTRCGWSKIRPRASAYLAESMRRSSIELPRRRNFASSMMMTSERGASHCRSARTSAAHFNPARQTASTSDGLAAGVDPMVAAEWCSIGRASSGPRRLQCWHL